MNKLGIVLGAAAVAIVAGCMDPNYVRPTTNVSQNTVKPSTGETATLTPDVQPVAEELPGYPGADTPDVDISVTPVASCTCLPGTVHDGPCPCGAPDCQCKVATPPPPPPAPAETVDANVTEYTVRPGDTLFLISKRFNVKLDAIRKANPQIKNDAIRAGQKITLPAKVELGKFAEPLPQPKPEPAPKKEFVPYTGPTVDYTVKSGDCVSRIAVKHGITSKQLMTLNNLSDANIRIGQKILVPATVAAPAAPKQEKAVVKSDKPKVAPPPASATPAVAVVTVEEPAKADETVVDDYAVVDESVAPAVDVKPATPAPAPAADQSGDYISYVVMKGEDITALSISFGIDPSVIREINNMGDDDQLVPGQTIRLPADAQ